jgi:phosphatidylglycerophosphatase A
VSEDQFDWFTKARSRIWARTPNLAAVPRSHLFVGTFAFSGLSPIASGTVGSLVAVLLYFIYPPLQSPIPLIIACILVLIIGTKSAGVIERTTGIQDPGIVVIDEVLGQWVALLFIPPEYNHVMSIVLIAFLLFRIFDVVKVPPARYFERKEGGLGIMLDDVVAGIYANIGTRIAIHFIYQ